MPQFLTTNSQLLCPHGGSVQFAKGDLAATASQGAVLHQGDTGTVTGCPFQIPAVAPIPSPCTTAVIAKADMLCRVGGLPSVNQTALILCFAATGIPQGPATVQNTQPGSSSL